MPIPLIKVVTKSNFKHQHQYSVKEHYTDGFKIKILKCIGCPKQIIYHYKRPMRKHYG